jgi:hypothetical protein
LTNERETEGNKGIVGNNEGNNKKEESNQERK